MRSRAQVHQCASSTFLGLRSRKGSHGGWALNDLSENQALELLCVHSSSPGVVFRDQRRLPCRRGPPRCEPCSAECRPRQGSRVHGASHPKQRLRPRASRLSRWAGCAALLVRPGSAGPQGVPGRSGRARIRSADRESPVRTVQTVSQVHQGDQTVRFAGPKGDVGPTGQRARGPRGRPAQKVRGARRAGGSAGRRREQAEQAGPQGATGVAGPSTGRRARWGSRAHRGSPERAVLRVRLEHRLGRFSGSRRLAGLNRLAGATRCSGVPGCSGPTRPHRATGSGRRRQGLTGSQGPAGPAGGRRARPGPRALRAQRDERHQRHERHQAELRGRRVRLARRVQPVPRGRRAPVRSIGTERSHSRRRTRPWPQ